MNKTEFMNCAMGLSEEDLYAMQDWLNEAKEIKKQAERVTLWKVEDPWEVFSYKENYRDAVNLLKNKADEFADNYMDDFYADFRLSLSYKRVLKDEVKEYIDE